jgi:hypothetical protein
MKNVLSAPTAKAVQTGEVNKSEPKYSEPKPPLPDILLELIPDNSSREPVYTEAQLACFAFFDVMPTQYPSKSEVKLVGNELHHLINDKWEVFFTSDNAPAMLEAVHEAIEQEIQDCLAQQRAEQRAERRNEEVLQGFYYGGDDDYPVNFDTL